MLRRFDLQSFSVKLNNSVLAFCHQNGRTCEVDGYELAGVDVYFDYQYTQILAKSGSWIPTRGSPSIRIGWWTYVVGRAGCAAHNTHFGFR
jgi:hypothetical protein